MYILGLNCYHGDSSACLVRDGALLFAVEEERFRRIKHWAGFPSESIRFCLSEAGLRLEDVDHVAVNSDPYASLVPKLRYSVRGRASLSLVLEKMRTRQRRQNLAQRLEEALPGQSFSGSAHRVEHHLAHLASGFLVSPFRSAAAVSVDGFGDFSSTSWGYGSDAQIKIDGRIRFPHSLGVFYQALTQYLGFPHYGDEYKVMGLAPYGQPRYMEAMREIVSVNGNASFELDLRFFRHHRREIGYEWIDAEPQVSQLFSDELVKLLGPARSAQSAIEKRHQDIARSVQTMYEEALFELLQRLHSRYQTENLALSGGCAMNSVANGRIREATGFRNVYVQPAAGDAGGAIGAAFVVWHQFSGRRSDFVMDHAYWGPHYTGQGIGAVIEDQADVLSASRCRIDVIDDEQELCDRIAGGIADGKVIGWFQGGMEWGPRALGNRSILCDPRRANMKDTLNQKIKRRESFRPFAPSILREAVANWFEVDDDVPFMGKVYAIRKEKQQQIPAVTHVDGSGRLHTVDRHANPRFWRLTRSFEHKTGVPLLLNTSFNENEPIVCRPQEALACFLRTDMDILVLGDFVVSRK